MAISEKVRLDAEIKIEVNEFKWAGKLSEIARIDIDNINQELERQPGLVSWFGVVQVEAIDRAKKTENELEALEEDKDLLYAKLDIQTRQAHQGDSKAPTESSVKSMILNSEEYRGHIKKIQNKREELREASKIAGKLSKIMLALDHKRDMVIQISSNNRKIWRTGDYEEKQ